MLNQIQDAGKTRKQINLYFTGTNGTVLYTVPAGKTCTGSFIGTPGSNGVVSVNQIDINLTQNTVAATSVYNVVLVEGTVLRAKGSSGNASFIGVEE